ncbi:NADPH-dependent 2,4-dienoyl-CoA reductase/sulfur reductase-like enzyme [Natronocella acetinitrilica]|uniref:NADPH-dependent 2,4-dienoyl-CoA reductase/sulfur reductase-like enzyme n=1 Tax=Natronocella acetinitrilica TaxID=414046 RepID=A0AAE3G634_9GAMM|nr:FAD/NAD(P)-binding oxidoreductase [Natronocella acetinitrilica]MCP1675401.1 NADPH-dependent 2,4-dienoyl-CoA reductase/sulfur reductase-like enzyme [Natronocella acetinitrilica]
MRHVIVGAGPAGVVAAESLRKIDADSDIVLLSGEPEPPYSRMAIPYLLIDQIDEKGTHLRKDAGYFESKGIDVRHGWVDSLDADKHQLKLQGGDTLDYDKLLLATGSHPVIPPIPGVDRENVHTCWTLADARQILSKAGAGSHVVLIGAGFIGCIILESLALRKTHLTVVEQQDRMVPRMMNDKAGGLIKRWCEDKGVAVHTDTKVEGVDQGTGGHPLAVKLDHGESIPADLVIVCVGVASNTGFLDGSGIRLDQGILVDRHLQSSLPDVYAAGDVAQGLDFSTGNYAVHAVQPTAADHGRVVASNMAGRPQLHQGSVNMNVLDTLGLISSSFGLWMGTDGGDSAELYSPERFRYLNLQFEDDRLVGASALGLTEHVGVIRGLIQSRVRLRGWKDKLKDDPTRLMEAYLANTQAIGHNAQVLKPA